jgi:hypothetical protein
MSSLAISQGAILKDQVMGWYSGSFSFFRLRCFPNNARIVRDKQQEKRYIEENRNMKDFGKKKDHNLLSH